MQKLSQPLEVLSDALKHAYQAALTNKVTAEDWDLPQIEVFAMFGQTWGSTALGFGGIGGAAMTTAYSLVLHYPKVQQYAVYFDGRFAYKVKTPSNEFFDDIKNRMLFGVTGSKERYECNQQTKQ